MNKGISCGQINLKISFSNELKHALNSDAFKYFKYTASTNINNINENVIQSRSIVIPSKSQQINQNNINKQSNLNVSQGIKVNQEFIPTKSYKLFNQNQDDGNIYENNNFSSQQMWSILNNNLVKNIELLILF